MERGAARYHQTGEIIKEFPGEVVALRWTCEECKDDTVTVFEASAVEKEAHCQFCDALTLVQRP